MISVRGCTTDASRIIVIAYVLKVVQSGFLVVLAGWRFSALVERVVLEGRKRESTDGEDTMKHEGWMRGIGMIGIDMADRDERRRRGAQQRGRKQARGSDEP